MHKVFLTCLFFGAVFGFSIQNKKEFGIVGGEDAKDKEFPYQVSIRTVNGIGITHKCGGSVVNEDWVLTAAHCCGKGFLGLHVTAGGIYLTKNEGVEQRVDVAKIIQHEDYQNYVTGSDICLLKLKTPLKLNENVQPVKLPAQNLETEGGTMSIVTGWGTKYAGGLLSNILQKVSIPVISDEQCRSDYSDFDNLPDSIICAGLEEGGKDSCQGDSGGPLVNADTRELIGIVSWGDGCADPGRPGVYTEVSHFINWINTTMEANK